VKTSIKIIGLILLMSIIIIGTIALLNLTKKKYQNLVKEGIKKESEEKSDRIKKDDIEKLPEPIQRYLNYVGVVGSEKVKNFRVTLEGNMKMERGADFLPYTAEQTTFQNQGIRLFYMDVIMKKMKISGLHHFNEDDARMKIKVLDVFTVVDEEGEKMRQAETVTFFNDMVVFAPQTLIYADIQWEVIDDFNVKAAFTHRGVTVHARLIFDEEGRIINFISNDRLALEKDGVSNNIPWSTPISKYHTVNGLNLPQYGEAIWHYEDGDFTYITLNVRDINYNIQN